MSRRLRDKVVVPFDMDAATVQKTIRDVEEVIYTQYTQQGRTPGADGYWIVYRDKLRERLAELILLDEVNDDTN